MPGESKRTLDLGTGDVHQPSAGGKFRKGPKTAPKAKKAGGKMKGGKGRHLRIRADIAEGGTLHVSHNLSDVGVTILLPPVSLTAEASDG